MKYTLAIVALLGLTAGIQKSDSDDKKGTSAAPIPHAPLGGMAKPIKTEFKVPKNTDAEPALSTTMDPYDYESGSGKTYHNKNKKHVKDEGPKKPEPIAGIEESTETAGTTTLWKINAGDSPDPKKIKDSDSEKEDKEEKKEKKDDDKEEKKEKSSDTDSFAQKFGLNPSTPISNSFLQTEMELEASCEPAIDVSQKQLDIELDYFSRNFDRKHYKKAMQVYKELKKQGLNPKTSIHTWELYDAAFSFPRVRRYDLVQKHMDLLQHFQDNLNENFTNQLHVDNFIRVANAAREALNYKYHQGEFSDPADYDPQADHPTTWSNANI